MKESKDIAEVALKGALVIIVIILALVIIGSVIEPFMETDKEAGVIVSSSADSSMLTLTSDTLDGLYAAIDGYKEDGYSVVTYPAPYSTKTSAEWFTTMER